jgi:hypothetical protein
MGGETREEGEVGGTMVPGGEGLERGRGEEEKEEEVVAVVEEEEKVY